MKALLDGLKGLGIARLAAMGAVAVGMLGMLGMLALRGASPSPYALLYADMDLREAGQVVDQLDKAHIPHQEQGGGQTVLVPSSDVAQARLLLAKGGLPSGGSIGYEIFDRGDSLTASSFQQEINQTRAMEGEIARSIRMISGIRAVRVHLVLPRRQPFTRQQQDAQASVVLTMAGGGRLDQEGVQAILNLVSAATPGLRPNNISIVDSRGNLLARAGASSDAGLGAQTGEELERQNAERLQHSVEEMLERTLGPGHVRAEASVQMNFDQTKQTEESYNPDQQVVRSTQTSSDNNKSTEAAEKPATVSNNLPNADAGQSGGAGAGSSQQRQQETTNYEIGRTTRTVVRDQPQISRISLAVMVDGLTTPGPDGKPAWHERSPEELARIATLVKSAVGFDEKRGDKVDVASMRFAAPDEPTEEAPHGTMFAGIRLEKQDLLSLAQTGVLALVALLALLFVLRPMVTRLTAVPAALAGGGLALAGPAGAALTDAAAPLGLPAPGRDPAVPALADESMVSLAQIDGQMRASSIRRIVELVERHPEESLTIVRGWVTQERD